MTAKPRVNLRTVVLAAHMDALIDRLAQKLAKNEVSINVYLRLCRRIRGEYTE